MVKLLLFLPVGVLIDWHDEAENMSGGDGIVMKISLIISLVLMSGAFVSWLYGRKDQ